VGSFSETAPTFSPFRCRKIATAQEAKKWLQNDELWEGVQRVAQNDLFTQFQAAGGKGALINEFGQALAQFFHTQQSSLKAKIASKQLKPEPTYLALYSIALGAFTEYGFREPEMTSPEMLEHSPMRETLHLQEVIRHLVRQGWRVQLAAVWAEDWGSLQREAEVVSMVVLNPLHFALYENVRFEFV